MHFSVIARWVLLPAVLLAGVLIAVLFCINLPWFDEELHPDLVRLASPKSFLMEGNALPWMYGIHAADDQDPLELGQEIVLAILNRARRNETRALTLREMYEDRGMIYDEAWKQDLSESRCEEGSDCLGSRRTEEVAKLAYQVVSFLIERHGLADMVDKRVRDVAAKIPIRVFGFDAVAYLHGSISQSSATCRANSV